MKAAKLIFTILLFLNEGLASAQTLTQTLRGNAVDFDSKVPLIGAKVVLPGTDALKALLSEYYNGRTDAFDTDTQLSFIPNIIYTIKF
jgi:hypothetical protein